jgi:PPOX class probable F420-dependent enzyme
MAAAPLPGELEAFLRLPNPAVTATLRADGHPHTAATWYLYEQGRALVNMDAGRRRLEYVRRDPRVSLTVLGGDGWHRHVSLEGHVDALEPDTDMTGIDRLARHYTGSLFQSRDRGRVNAWIEIQRWHAWAGTGPWIPAE